MEEWDEMRGMKGTKSCTKAYHKSIKFVHFFFVPVANFSRCIDAFFIWNPSDPPQTPLNSLSLSQFFSPMDEKRKNVLKIQQRAKIAQNRFDVAIGAVETRLMFDYFPLLFYHSHLKIIHSFPLLLSDSAAMRKKRFKIANKKKFSSSCHICGEFEAAREFFFDFPWCFRAGCSNEMDNRLKNWCNLVHLWARKKLHCKGN